MKGAIPLIAIIAIGAVLVGTGYILSNKGNLPMAVLADEAVFCNQYEFQCCAYPPDSSATQGQSTILGYYVGNQNFQCLYDQCKIMSINSRSSCANPTYETIYSGSTSYRASLAPGQILNYNDTVVESDVWCHLSFSYLGYNRQLYWTGSAAGTTGVPVWGSDKCSFVTDRSVYNQNGQLVKNVQQSGTSYTVPVNTCYLVARSTQYICGTKSNQCETHADCVAGHSYTYTENGVTYGAEAETGQIQIYRCNSFGSQPSQDQLNLFPGESQSSTQFQFGNRCTPEARTVQCTPGSNSCGTNGVCDVATFTCRQTGSVRCNSDAECGTSQVYDMPTKTFYRFACSNPGTTQSACNRVAVRTVECYYNSECPANWYCDVDNTCKETTQPKQACPTTCCVGDARYFDKPAPTGNVCCPGGQSYAPSLDQCTPKDCGFLGLGCLLYGFADALGTLAMWLLIFLVLIIVIFVLYLINKFTRGRN